MIDGYQADWTVTFSQPVSGLYLHMRDWRGGLTVNDDPPVQYTFDQLFTVVNPIPGLVQSANTITLDDDTNLFYTGLLRFDGPVSSLSVLFPEESGGNHQQAMTFSQIPEPTSMWCGGRALPSRQTIMLRDR